MPTLILEQDGNRRGGRLRGRVVIGRRPNNHICIPDRTVSRIHAWIGQSDDGYFVSDTGSRAGTRVNGEPITGKATLKDGDRIRIGSAEIIFRSTSTLPRGMGKLDLSDRKLDSSDGIFVDCACGAPLWAPWDFAGRVGQCRYCGQMVSLPQSKTKPPGADLSSETVFGGTPAIRDDAPAAPAKVSVARRAPAAAPKLSLFDKPQSTAAVFSPTPQPLVTTQTLCGACQSQISVLEETTRCPECGVTFHAECWTENRGCSSYGCSQVGVLDTTLREPVFAQEIPFPAIRDVSEPRGIGWEYLLLPASLITAAVGMLTFGVPAVLLLIGIGWAWPKIILTPRRNLVICAAVVSLIGAIGGAWFSWYWWLAPPAMVVAR